MPLVTSHKMLLDAQRGAWAVGAFNAENMEMVLAIIRAAEELCAPVIIQTTPSTVRYAGAALYAANVRAAAEQASVPVALHLDHGNSIALAEHAMRVGYSSVMIDGSRESFEDNIAMTRTVVTMATRHGIPVEGELGAVGGKEDDLEAEASCTLPHEAAEFAARTGVSSLAIAIGTAHGVYRREPKLDLERLTEIRNATSVPLVLHGASGLRDDAVRSAIARGICKVNFATELRIAYTSAVREVLEKSAVIFDPKVYGQTAIARVCELVKERMTVCGCAGKAKNWEENK